MFVFLYVKESASESFQSQLPAQDTIDTSLDSGSLAEGKSIEKAKDKEEKVKEPEKEKGKERDTDKKGENGKEKLKNLEGANLDALLQRLPGCVSRDLIDQLTVIMTLFLQCGIIFCLLFQLLFLDVYTSGLCS